MVFFKDWYLSILEENIGRKTKAEETAIRWSGEIHDFDIGQLHLEFDDYFDSYVEFLFENKRRSRVPSHWVQSERWKIELKLVHLQWIRKPCCELQLRSLIQGRALSFDPRACSGDEHRAISRPSSQRFQVGRPRSHWQMWLRERIRRNSPSQALAWWKQIRWKCSRRLF